MMLLVIVLAFLLPVILVFGYSVWRYRKRPIPGAAQIIGDPEKKTFSALAQKCTDLKNSVSTGSASNIEKDIDSVLEVARSLKDQNLREMSLSHVMGIYVAIGREQDARALLAEVKDEANRVYILEEVFGDDS
jgi:hypothetical protein